MLKLALVSCRSSRISLSPSKAPQGTYVLIAKSMIGLEETFARGASLVKAILVSYSPAV